jgi:hypothetical protein
MQDLFNPPALVRPAEDLASLLAAAKAEHEAGEQATRKGLEHYRKAGEVLSKAKSAAGHGNWLPALKRTGIPQQRASEYMRLATGWDKLPPGGSFGLKEALALIEAASAAAASPLPPEAAPGTMTITLGVPGQEPALLGSVSEEDKAFVLTLPRGDAGVRLTAVGAQFFGEPDFGEWVVLMRGMECLLRQSILARPAPKKMKPYQAKQKVLELGEEALALQELDAFLSRCEAALTAPAAVHPTDRVPQGAEREKPNLGSLS